MTIQPIHDFKEIRKSLTVEQQIHLDNLVFSISDVIPHLLELQITDHIIEFTLISGKKVKFLIDLKKNIGSVMFM